MQVPKLVTQAGCLILAAAGVSYAASLSTVDRQFLVTVARMDMTEAHQGQMAASQATRADVKDYAKTVVDDDTASYADVSQLAAKTGVTIPKGINSGQNRTIVQLVHLKGDRFDRQFANDGVAADRQLLTAFQHEAKNGRDPDVKAYASKTIPTIQKHLQAAEKCARPVGRT
jgi:putative membrane protein